MTSLLLLLLALAGITFFAGSQTVFISADRLNLHMQLRQTDQEQKNAVLEDYLEHPDRYYTTVLAGQVFSLALFGILIVSAFTQPVVAFLETTGGITSEVASIVIIGLAALLVLLIVGELLPRTIFASNANRYIRVILLINNLFYRVFWILIKATQWMLDRILSRPGQYVSDEEASNGRGKESDEEGEGVAHPPLSENQYDDDPDESRILQNVMELSTKRVKESMIPRTDIVALERQTSIDDALETFISTGFSKLPVYEGNIDNVIGVVFAYDLFNKPDSLPDILRDVKLVPSSQKSKDLLSEFRNENVSLAIVMDEYGGTAGMVTIEDLLEEVVGDIQDEYDTKDHIMKRIAPGTYVLSGNVELDELKESYPEIDLFDDTENYETLAGYIINHIGRIPTVNEELMIEGNTFIISKATPSRIETVKLIMWN